MQLVGRADVDGPLDHARQPVLPGRSLLLDDDPLRADHRLHRTARIRRAGRAAQGAPAHAERAGVAVGRGVGVDQVRDAEEVGHEQRRRLLVDLARRSRLLDVAAAHHGDPVAHRQRLLLVVRDEDERDPELGLQGLQLDLQVLAQARVERAERLVEEQHLRRQDEGPRERHPLLLPAGELARLPLRVVAELDERERLGHPGPMLRLRQPLVLEPEADVARDVEMREERVALEDRVDVPLVGRHLRHVDVVEHDPAARRPLEAGDHPQRRRLPAAGGADHGEELAARHPHVDAVDGDRPRRTASSAPRDGSLPASGLYTSTPAMAAASSRVANRR